MARPALLASRLVPVHVADMAVKHMKIALMAANGKFVCAEDGGGSLVRANREAIGPWETFDLIGASNLTFAPTVALQTASGLYLSAEDGGGGVLSANRDAIGPWETFTLSHGTLLASDQLHYVCCEVGSDDPILNVTRTEAYAWETFAIVVLDPLPGPIPHPIAPVLREWRGCFCIPHALPGIPYGDGSRIWTPAYGCYDDIWRTAIRTAYQQRGYTHFVYNCAGLPYRHDYPELADDPTRVNRDLIELMGSGLVPVVCATDDRRPDRLCDSFIHNGGSIAISFPMWEQNGPVPSEDGQKALIDATVAAAPSAECYLHFTPGHGSISYRSEIDGWKWCQAHGTTGLLAQGSNTFAAEDPKTGGEGLESTAVRLLGLPSAPPAWGGLRQLTVKFEYGVMSMYANQVDEPTMRAYTESFLAYAPHVVGFGDGGPATVTT